MAASDNRRKKRRGGDNDKQSARVVLDPDRYVPALINGLATQLVGTAAGIYRGQCGVGSTEMRILVLLGARSPISGTDIGRLVTMDKAAVSRALAVLESMGLVSSELDPTHGRRRYLRLTDSGWALQDKGVALSIERESRLLSNFTKEEQELLLKFLNRMLSNIETVAALEIDQQTLRRLLPG